MKAANLLPQDHTCMVHARYIHGIYIKATEHARIHIPRLHAWRRYGLCTDAPTCIDMVLTRHIQGTCTVHARYTHRIRRQHHMHSTSTGYASKQHHGHRAYMTALTSTLYTQSTHNACVVRTRYICITCAAHAQQHTHGSTCTARARHIHGTCTCTCTLCRGWITFVHITWDTPHF